MPRVARKTAGDLPRDFDALVREHPPCAIHDDVAYENTQEVIDRLTNLPAPTEDQLKYLDTLTTLFEAYENERHAIDAKNLRGLDLLKHLLEENQMSYSDLGRILGERSLGSKIMGGSRRLGLEAIKKLAARFNVDPGLFVE